MTGFLFSDYSKQQVEKYMQEYKTPLRASAAYARDSVNIQEPAWNKAAHWHQKFFLDCYYKFFNQ